MPYVDDMNSIWQIVRESFRPVMEESSFNLWFGDLEVIDFDDKQNIITIACKSEYKMNIIRERYTEPIQLDFYRLLGFHVTVEFKFVGTPADPAALKKRILGETGPETDTNAATGADPAANTPAAANATATANTTEENGNASAGSAQNGMPDYNFEYTFDNFIVGDSNKFAHAACTAVADRPAQDYNPLFIYGPSGLGKTHLLRAIINEMLRKNPKSKIVYVKGEDFTNEMIECIAKQSMKDFRNKYRNCDVLLIDDIQFIAGKVSTQEEFFHTFNTLFEAHKQIILTSDRPPKDINPLEERLKSRFEWGLIADIQPPNLELRIAIIKNKAEQVHVKISDEVLTFLAENLRSNIRQIEGSIKKLGALSFLSGAPIDMTMAMGCIMELLGGEEPVTTTVNKILRAVELKYNVSRDDLKGPKQSKEITAVRHTTIYLIRQITDMSLPNIGRIFNRDHSTVLASIRAVEKKKIIDPAFVVELEEIEKKVKEMRSVYDK